MRATLVTAVLLLAALAGESAARQPHRPAEVARARMEHHLAHAGRLAEHFEGVLARACPRFASPDEWQAYLDGEIDQVVLLLAHLEEAWIEAKHTGDDDVRRAAKAPRRRAGEARALIDKLAGCAGEHGVELSPLAAWKRIERAVPPRQAQIALPPAE
jgi:hypothetical protein